MLFAALFTLLAGCGSDPAPAASTPAAADPHAHHAHHAAPPAAEPIPGASVYQLDATLTDASGAEVKLADLAGQPRLLALVYTHCDNVCPRTVADMSRIVDELGEAADGLGMVLVSIDPERDTPERMRTFAAEHGLDLDRWTLLRGEEHEVRALATVLGVQYRRTSPTDFAHSNVVHLLDAQGVLVHRQEGLGTDPAATVAAARGLLDR